MIALDPIIMEFVGGNIFTLFLIKTGLNLIARLSKNNTTNLVADWFSGMVETITNHKKGGSK